MASLTQWTWAWASSSSWWWTGKPGVLQSVQLQRFRHEQLNWTEPPSGHASVTQAYAPVLAPTFPWRTSWKLSSPRTSGKGKASQTILFKRNHSLSTIDKHKQCTAQTPSLSYKKIYFEIILLTKKAHISYHPASSNVKILYNYNSIM